MISVVKKITLQSFNIEWINAISKIGYLAINFEPGTSDDFPQMWLLADQCGQFFRESKDCQADAVAYHYYECQDNPKKLFVIPRFDGEYEDHNQVYNISESENQPETSSTAVIEALIPQLIENVNNHYQK